MYSYTSLRVLPLILNAQQSVLIHRKSMLAVVSMLSVVLTGLCRATVSYVSGVW